MTCRRSYDMVLAPSTFCTLILRFFLYLYPLGFERSFCELDHTERVDRDHLITSLKEHCGSLSFLGSFGPNFYPISIFSRWSVEKKEWVLCFNFVMILRELHVCVVLLFFLLSKFFLLQYYTSVPAHTGRTTFVVQSFCCVVSDSETIHQYHFDSHLCCSNWCWCSQENKEWILCYNFVMIFMEKGSCLCRVLLLFSGINPSCHSTVLQYSQHVRVPGRTMILLCGFKFWNNTPTLQLSPSLLSDNCGAVVWRIFWFCESTIRRFPRRWDADYHSFRKLSQSPARGSQHSSWVNQTVCLTV